MEKLASFEIDHTKLKPGIYVSSENYSSEGIGNKPSVVATTLDIRFLKPNSGSAIKPKALHTIEHLGALFLRNKLGNDEVIYFGPMGCRTGFYLIVRGEVSRSAITYLNFRFLITSMLNYIKDFEGEIPGATIKECGNYKEHDLAEAKKVCEAFRRELYVLKSTDGFEYPR